MALQAIVQSEMGFPLVATVAWRDDILVPWGVADMAILAGDLVAVGHAIALQGGDDGRMALHAIIKRELCYWWRRIDWFGEGIVFGLTRELQGEKQRYDQAKIFGCKYQLAYYYHGDVALRRWRGHFVVFKIGEHI